MGVCGGDGGAGPLAENLPHSTPFLESESVGPRVYLLTEISYR